MNNSTKTILGFLALLMNVVEVRAQAPTITSFSPSSGCAGTSVRITGTNLTGVTAVTFGDSNAASYTINSDNAITAIVGSNGSGLIKVTGASGMGVSANNFLVANGFNTYAYVANSSTVSVVNVATNAVETTIPILGSYIYGICLSPNGTKTYVANNGYNTVVVINTATNLVEEKIPVGSNPKGICVSPDGTKVYVVNEASNNVSIINTVTNKVTATINVGTSPQTICFNPNGNTAYVVNKESNNVSVINTANNTVTATISVGYYPECISVSPFGQYVYVTNNVSNSISVINANTNTVFSTVSVGLNPKGICISPNGEYVYVTNYNSKSISIINADNNLVTATINSVNDPYGISITPDGKKIYVVTSDYAGSIRVINTATNSISSPISVGLYPISVGNFITNVGIACKSLPLNLITLTAQQQSNTVSLFWQTTNEVNTSHFIIQHSVDGTNFSDMGNVAAKGDGGYSYTDNQLPSASVVYYRLQMVDKDGSFTYSKVVSCKLTDASKTLAVYPNPVRDNLFVQITSTKAEKITLQVTDLQGRILQQEDTQVGIGNVSLSINTSTLAKGSYVLLVKGSGGVQQKQFVKE